MPSVVDAELGRLYRRPSSASGDDQDGNAQPLPDAVFILSYADREEKGSDVNVAAQLLIDVLGGAVDAALIISNDSNLRFPVDQARQHVPVGVLHPSRNYLAGDVRGGASAGAGRHWWANLTQPTSGGGSPLPPRWGRPGPRAAANPAPKGCHGGGSRASCS